jgi:hypothetical protein
VGGVKIRPAQANERVLEAEEVKWAKHCVAPQPGIKKRQINPHLIAKILQTGGSNLILTLLSKRHPARASAPSKPFTDAQPFTQ